MVGSSAKLMNAMSRERAPVSSNSFKKYAYSRCVIPMAPKTTRNSSPSPRTWAFFRIMAAIWFAGKPAPEKIGNFWPRTRVLKPSMAEIPVWMKSEGLSRATGFIGTPIMGIRFSGMMGGRPSIGSPRPLKIRPIMSLETPNRATSSTSRIRVDATSMPKVPSRTWITA